MLKRLHHGGVAVALLGRDDVEITAASVGPECVAADAGAALIVALERFDIEGEGLRALAAAGGHEAVARIEPVELVAEACGQCAV